jgi:hypothetical protein
MDFLPWITTRWLAHQTLSDCICGTLLWQAVVVIAASIAGGCRSQLGILHVGPTSALGKSFSMSPATRARK